MPPPSELDALKNGSLDASFTSEPWVTRFADQSGAKTWKGFEEILPDAQYGAIFFGPNLLRDDPGAGQRFIDAYLEAVALYDEGKTDANVEAIHQLTSLDSDLLKQICWPSFRKNGQINVDSVLAFQTWAVAHGWLDGELSSDQLWDASFVQAAEPTSQ
jgi:NitT/TauT family transport system substrate-binding protein